MKATLCLEPCEAKTFEGDARDSQMSSLGPGDPAQPRISRSPASVKQLRCPNWEISFEDGITLPSQEGRIVVRMQGRLCKKLCW